MQHREQCRKILTWITDNEFAKKILENSEVLSEENLPTFAKLPDSLLDENVNITLIEEYCAGNTFIKLKQLVKEKSKCSAWKCGTCSKFLGKKHSILCDRCLLSLHYNCSKLKKKPVGNWFCMKCVADFEEGNSLQFVIYINLGKILLLLKMHNDCTECTFNFNGMDYG